MYARMNIIFGEKDKVGAGIDRIERSDRPVVEATTGNRGLATMVDREAGVIVATSYWDEPLHSSEAALTEAREAAAAAAGGDLVVERFELAYRALAAAPVSGAAVRMTRVHLDLSAVTDGLAFFGDTVMPAVSAVPGFCSAELLIDRDSGNGIVVTVWNDTDDADRGERALAQLRDTAEVRVGAKFVRSEAYSLVRTSAQLD
jgi:hypothetical protein